MNNTLTRVALRHHALFLDILPGTVGRTSAVTAPVLAFVARLNENGFCVSEPLLRALGAVPADELARLAACVGDVMGADLNWAPLVKGWDVPTGESVSDHMATFFVQMMGGGKAGFRGATLPCGHFIPEGTFALERYNGCPFCGTPFHTSQFVYKGQGSKLKELRLFTDSDMRHLFSTLLTSATPLDATQKDTLGLLLGVYPLPGKVDIAMKETAMLVVKTLVEQGREAEAAPLMSTPNDVLRYLWYEKTGYVQIIQPKTLIAHAGRMYSHIWEPLDRNADAAAEMKRRLMLRYNRKECLCVARWLNAVPMSACQAAENMNPRRGMWVRMIRALRLGEYSRRKGMEHLAHILDVFYRHSYDTWQGSVDKARQTNDATRELDLLRQRPGLFARCLFATMLRYGSERVLQAFDEVADRLPARLLVSLGDAAWSYFCGAEARVARPVTGVARRIEPNRLLALYDEHDRQLMARGVNGVYLSSMQRRFAAQPTASKTIYIHPSLYSIPISVGNRSATVQDASCALMGTRFPVEGECVRLFLQWGKGLHAQDLDMDLSCRIALPDGHTDYCYFGNLTCKGAKHSGDIRAIPEMVGTAEYIELSLPELEAEGATYVTFTCNAYSCGSLTPNLVVGWMNSSYPMRVSESEGVAYDPSCVQHMVRIGNDHLLKGLVFGVLDVARREIVWLEMPYTAQTIHQADNASVEALLRRLEAKVTIGALLDMKARAQHLMAAPADAADEAYTYEWALNAAEVSRLLALG